MKLHLVQIQPELNNKEANLQKILDYVDNGIETGADLIAFGELALVGCDSSGVVRYNEVAEPIPGPSTEKILAKLKGTHCMVLFGMAENERGDIYNAAPLIGSNGVIGVARKLYLANFESPLFGITLAEGIHFKPGKWISILDTKLGRIGIEICYDGLHPEISYAQAIAGCWLILIPSATPLIIARPPGPSPIALARAYECNACICLVNIVGEQAGQSYNGGTCVILERQGMTAQASIGKGAVEEVLEYEIDPSDIYAARMRYPLLRDARPDLMKQLWEITDEARSGA